MLFRSFFFYSFLLIVRSHCWWAKLTLIVETRRHVIMWACICVFCCGRTQFLYSLFACFSLLFFFFFSVLFFFFRRSLLFQAKRLLTLIWSTLLCFTMPNEIFALKGNMCASAFLAIFAEQKRKLSRRWRRDEKMWLSSVSFCIFLIFLSFAHYYFFSSIYVFAYYFCFIFHIFSFALFSHRFWFTLVAQNDSLLLFLSFFFQLFLRIENRSSILNLYSEREKSK